MSAVVEKSGPGLLARGLMRLQGIPTPKQMEDARQFIENNKKSAANIAAHKKMQAEFIALSPVERIDRVLAQVGLPKANKLAGAWCVFDCVNDNSVNTINNFVAQIQGMELYYFRQLQIQLSIRILGKRTELRVKDDGLYFCSYSEHQKDRKIESFQLL